MGREKKIVVEGVFEMQNVFLCKFDHLVSYGCMCGCLVSPYPICGCCVYIFACMSCSRAGNMESVLSASFLRLCCRYKT